MPLDLPRLPPPTSTARAMRDARASDEPSSPIARAEAPSARAHRAAPSEPCPEARPLHHLPDLGGIWIRRPLEGKALVDRAQRALGPGTVTSARRERKAPVRRETLEEMMVGLRGGGVGLVGRDGPSSGQASGTLTYYGDAARFYNHGVVSKIRMRIRYYVTFDPEAADEAPGIQRAEVTSTCGFLELKIKNPSAGQDNRVDKLRVLAPDEVLARLVHLDPSSAGFHKELNAIREALLGLEARGRPRNAPEVVGALVEIIEELVRRDVAFLRPNLVITYRRTAYSIQDDQYPVPTYVESPARGWARGWGPRASRPRIEEARQAIEFQLTVDEDVCAHRAVLPEAGETRMPVEAYFDPRRGTRVARYPRDAVVVELKEPMTVAGLARSDRSKKHDLLIDLVLRRMESHIYWGRFDEQVGKHGSFARRLAETRGRRPLEVPIELEPLPSHDPGAPTSARPRRAPLTASRPAPAFSRVERHPRGM